MAKKFNNFGEMIEGLTGKDELSKKLKQDICRRSLAKYLFFLRCNSNLTQKELADKINCTQSRISKIEGNYDEDLSIKDIIDYGKALGFTFEIGLRPNDVRIVDQLNFHIEGIKDCLNRLTKICDGDTSIEKGVFDCFKQTLFKMIETVMENVVKLKTIREKMLPTSKQPIHIAPPIPPQVQERISEENLPNKS